MKLRAEKIKCALNASPRLQSQKSPLLLMGLEKMFRTKETKAIASPLCFSLSLSFSVRGAISSGGGRGQTIRLTVRVDYC